MAETTGIWGTQHDVDGLIDLFGTINPHQYDGASAMLCLMGFPTNMGVLQDEYYAYVHACRYTNEGAMTCDEWLACRYNVDKERMATLFGMACDAELRHDLDVSIKYAREWLTSDSDLPFDILRKIIG